MTISVIIQVHDGLVLASDSASTLVGLQPNGQQAVLNVYNHADKTFNLVRGLPIGAITAGAGSIGISSISTLAKDLRRRFSNPEDADWFVDPKTYTIEEVAQKARRFLYEERYVPQLGQGANKPSLSFKVCGYSAGSEQGEVWSADISNGNCPEPTLLRTRGDHGISWDGDGEAIQRLILGMGSNMGNALVAGGIAQGDLQNLVNAMMPHLQVDLHSPPMPIQDAIDLAKFLVDLTIMFTRFKCGAQTVGGAIEIAAITRHEGFKWVKRKHYFSSELNPEIPNANLQHDCQTGGESNING